MFQIIYHTFAAFYKMFYIEDFLYIELFAILLQRFTK